MGSGLAADYAGIDVKGKIVVVDSSMDNFWFNMQGGTVRRGTRGESARRRRGRPARAGPFPKRCPRE